MHSMKAAAHARLHAMTTFYLLIRLARVCMLLHALLIHRMVKYLYDGDCAMCRSLKAVLERQDNRKGKLSFVDISDPYYDPMQNMGIDYGEAMETIHAIRNDGTVCVLCGWWAARLPVGPQSKQFDWGM